LDVTLIDNPNTNGLLGETEAVNVTIDEQVHSTSDTQVERLDHCNGPPMKKKKTVVRFAD